MIRYVSSPSFYDNEFKNLDIISSYDFIQVEDCTGSYTRVIKTSKKDFEEDLVENLERKVKDESIKNKSRKFSKRK